jgi:acetylornithine deacetylase
MPINVATIEGGRAINIVPGTCTITCERRIFPGENPQKIVKTVKSTLQKIRHVKTTCDFNPNVQLPYIVNKNEEVVQLATKAITQKIGHKPKLRIELGRTDSIYFDQIAKIKTAIIGPGHMGHTAGEHINTDRLHEFTEILLTMLEKET